MPILPPWLSVTIPPMTDRKWIVLQASHKYRLLCGYRHWWPDDLLEGLEKRIRQLLADFPELER